MSAQAAASSNAAGKRKASAPDAGATVPRASLDNAIKHYELEAAKSAELQMVVYTLQARNDNLEMANKALDKSRNSLGCQLAYLDRMLIHSRNPKTGKPLNDRTKKDYLETARKDEQQAWRWANDPVRAQIEHHKASSAKKVYDWCQRQAA